MNFNGILVGAVVFFSIGICHPIVIKLEYYLGKKGWVILLAAGLILATCSVLIHNITLSTLVGGMAFSCLWGIPEMFMQEKRVLKGWFPENPARHDYYERLRREKGMTTPSQKGDSKLRKG